MDILIGDYIKNQLFKYNELDKSIENNETKKLIKFKQLYPHSILTKYIENINLNPIHKKELNGKEIFKFYQPIYFSNFNEKNINTIVINQSKLEQLTKLCQNLNTWSKSKILLPNNFNKNINCIEKDFYYYKFNIFGSYYYLNQSQIPIMYVHKYRKSVLLNVSDICLFWKNIYLNLYEIYDKNTLKQFKKRFRHFIFKSGIIKNYINQSEQKFIYIQFDTLNKKFDKYTFIGEKLDLKTYNKVEPYCKRINDIEFETIKNYPKCFNVKETNRFITFEFGLLKYL